MKRLRDDVGMLPLLMALATAAVGCGAAEAPPEAASSAEGEVPALTREEIQERAEAMSPAMAESLGIVDTTIRIESPVPAESLRAPGSAPDSVLPQ